MFGGIEAVRMGAVLDGIAHLNRANLTPSKSFMGEINQNTYT